MKILSYIVLIVLLVGMADAIRPDQINWALPLAENATIRLGPYGGITFHSIYGMTMQPDPLSAAYLMMRTGSSNSTTALNLVPHSTVPPGSSQSALNLFMTDWSTDQTNFEALNIRAQDNEFALVVDASGTGVYRPLIVNSGGSNVMTFWPDRSVEFSQTGYYDTSIKINASNCGQKQMLGFYGGDGVADFLITKYGTCYGSGLDRTLQIEQEGGYPIQVKTTNSSAVKVELDGTLGIRDGMTAPATTSGYACIYVDTADGDLKIKFADGTTKTIVVDT